MRPATAALTELLLAASWAGATLLFVSIVAPAAFAVLPSRTLAGALVGRVLPALFYSGMLVGAAVVALEALAGRGLAATPRVAAGVVLAIACAVAQLGVGARIASIRAAIGGPIESLAPDDARRIAFGRLHAMSVGWLGLAGVASLVVALLAFRLARRGS